MMVRILINGILYDCTREDYQLTILQNYPSDKIQIRVSYSTSCFPTRSEP